MAPPANAGALGAAEIIAPFVAFVRPRRLHEDDFVNGVTSLQQCDNRNVGYDLLWKPVV